MTTLVKTIRADPLYTEYKSVLTAAGSSCDTERLLTEAAVSHGKRPSRKLYRSSLNHVTLFAAAAEDASIRSRLVEIRVTLSRQVDLLDMSINALAAHVHSTYQNELREAYSTEGSRKAFISKVTCRGVELRDEYLSAVTQLDSYINDIDKTSYMIRAAVDLLKLQVERTLGKI